MRGHKIGSRLRRVERPRPRRCLERLAATPAFARCSAQELALIDSITCETRVRAGYVLAREGEEARQANFVVSGRAVAVTGGEVVGGFGPGSCIGCRNIVNAFAHETTIVAERPMLVRAATTSEVRLMARLFSSVQAWIETIPDTPDGCEPYEEAHVYRVNPAELTTAF
jgi:CRP-like cAMP-binding protein